VELSLSLPCLLEYDAKVRLILRDFFSMNLKQQNRDTQKVSRFVLTRVRKYYKLV